jgi:alpha-L-fucosidase
MGLDWRPLGKPKAGFENKYYKLFRLLQDKEKQELSFWDKLKGKKPATREQLLEEWYDISVETYETIKAPRVGYDQVANEWIKKKYEGTDNKVTFEEFRLQLLGYYVIELAEELDGVPVYMAFGQDENVFRAQFLDNCKELIGEDLYNSAWNTKLADETLVYGQKLLEIANKVASENKMLYLKDQRIPPEADEESLESKIHILYAAAKWLIFYGKNGHGYEADF